MSDGSVIDYSDRGDHVAHFILAPEDAPAWAADSEELWKRAGAAEIRADAQEARTIEISFPRELEREDWIELSKRLGHLLVQRGMVVQIDIHCPNASDGLPNPHAHVMATMREIRGGVFARLKARHWNELFHRKAGILRRDWTLLLNQYCKDRGVDYRADHRTNVERGLPPAEARLPRWNILHYRRTGQKTTAMEERDRERAAKAEIAKLESKCNEIEHELELALLDAEPDLPAGVFSAELGQERQTFPTQTMPAFSRSPHVDDPWAPAFSVVADDELPGSRYGP